MSPLSRTVSLLSIAVSLASLPATAVQRTFVASFGSDANAASECTRNAPCRSFQTAVNVVEPNGEVLALDSIGYGIVTLTKSVSLIAAPGVYAGISVSTGVSGVTIATPGISVTLRGLIFNSIGGNNGVSMTNGAGLSVENCVFSNFQTSGSAGVFVDTLAARVKIIDSLFRDNEIGVQIHGSTTASISGTKIIGSGSSGVFVYGAAANAFPVVSVSESILSHNNTAVYAFESNASALVRVAVIRSTLANNTFGVRSQFGGGPTVISVSESMLTGNNTAFAQDGAGSTVESFGNNTTRFNGGDVGTVSAAALR